MKKLISAGFIVALAGIAWMSVAHARHHDDNSNSQEVQTKMAATRTDAERQQLLAEQHESMQGIHDHPHSKMHGQMGAHGHHAMKNCSHEEMHQRIHSQQ